MVLSVPSCNSSQIKACHVALSSTMRQRSFQGIDTNSISDPSLKFINDSLYPKTGVRKTDQKTRTNRKQNSAEITECLIQSFHLFIL